MSNYELNVTWPAFFEAKAEQEKAGEREQFDAELERGTP